MMKERRNMKRNKKRREASPEDRQREAEATLKKLETWKPRTDLGRKVKAGEITDIDQIVDSGLRIMEQEIVDSLLPGLNNDLLMIGQSKGKFGGGQRRAFKQTQKKTAEGNKPSFATMVVVGNRNGYVGLGYGKSRETVLSREKALRNAKINLIKVRRGCGSWQCGCRTPHTIPFKVSGKCGSVKIELMAAPKGSGLRVAEECKKMLALAGISDVWSKMIGHQKSKMNVVYACRNALLRMSEMKASQKERKALGITEGVVEVPKEGVGNE